MSAEAASATPRDERIDAAKGLGIILVFLGHAFLYGSYPSRWIFYFHMPLFFFVSGVFENEKRHASTTDMLRRLYNTLLVPFLFYSVLGLVLHFLTYGRGQLDVPWPVWQKRLLSLYAGQPFYLGSLWFVSCLAGVKVLFHFLVRLSVRIVPPRRRLLGWIVVLVVLFLVGKSLRHVDGSLFPFKLLSVPMASVYYVAGFLLLRQVISRRSGRLWIVRTVAFLGFAVVAVVAALYGKNSNMCCQVYSKTLLWILGSGGGIVGTIALTRLWSPAFLQWIGRNSLHFFLLEAFAVYACVTMLGACGVEGLSYSVFTDEAFPRPWIAVIVPAALLLVAAVIPAVGLAYGRFARVLRIGAK